jgi:hypothetical protein
MTYYTCLSLPAHCSLSLQHLQTAWQYTSHRLHSSAHLTGLSSDEHVELA